jgi:ketoreductase
MTKALEGTVALVTGASSGIGEATALALASHGAKVAVTGRRLERLERLAERIGGQGQTALAIQSDITDQAQAIEAVDRTADELGRLDIVVANAGIASFAQAWEMTEQQWDDVIATNLGGVWKTARAAVPAILERDEGGAIVFTSSTAGFWGTPYMAHYVAAKHGVIGLTRALAMDVAKDGVTVNAVCPGYVETPMAERVRAGYASMAGISEAEVLTQFNAKIPLGRYSTVDEIAGLADYLATDAAASITAQGLNVCGGLGIY